MGDWERKLPSSVGGFRIEVPHREPSVSVEPGGLARGSALFLPSDQPEALPLARRDHRCTSHRDSLHGRPDREVKPRLGAVDVAIGDDVASAGASDHALSLVLLDHVDDKRSENLPGVYPDMFLGMVSTYK